MANIREIGAASTTTDTTVTTTTETIAISSALLAPPADSYTAVVIGWAQLTTGTNTTAVTPRIRRGASITGTLVMEANAENIKAAAGSTEPFVIMVREDINGGLDFAQYSLTLQQTAASANGSILQASILVMLL